jgi:RNA polymerase sigma-70 factor (ECF subfamily)
VVVSGTERAGEVRSSADVGRLFDEHAAFLLRVVGRLVGSPDQAEDVVQRVFLIAHEKRSELAEHAEVRGWLYRVAINVARHERRAFARRQRLHEALAELPEGGGPEDPSRQLEAAEASARVRACVARLPFEQREVFVLYELEELRGGEIAAMLEVPENTVWSRLRLARARFKRAWLASGEGPRAKS